MSDDDPKNVEHIEKVMRDELSIKYPLSTFRVYDTSKRGYRKIAINEDVSDNVVNPDYEWFVVHNNKVISGWEYEDDAWDHYNEIVENDMEAENSLSVMDIEECEEEDIDPFNYDNWSNFPFDSDIISDQDEAKMESFTEFIKKLK
jgi:hypothetical protein